MPNPPASKRVATIKDVAALADVSWKTVTNVVHNRPNVRPSTRQRVLDAIKQLDYHPGLAGRQLRQGRSKTLTLIVPDVLNPYFSKLMWSTIVAADQRGYAVFVEPAGLANGHLGRERLAASAALRFAFDGVLISPAHSNPKELAALAARLPVVLLGESTRRADLDRVEIDNVAAASEVTAHLTSTGRTKIAFLGDRRRPSEPSARRLLGYRRALKAAGVAEHTDANIVVEHFYPSEGESGAARLLASCPDVDAIVCVNDLIAIGAMRHLRRAGIRVPDDIAVTGWDDIPSSAYVTPTLTTIAPDTDAIAAEAVDLLIDRIEGTTRPAKKVTVGHRLIVRESSVRSES